MIKKYYDNSTKGNWYNEPIHFKTFSDETPDATEILKSIYKFNAKGRALFRGEYSTGDASKDDFQLLLILIVLPMADAELMLDLFYHSALNRMEIWAKEDRSSIY